LTASSRAIRFCWYGVSEVPTVRTRHHNREFQAKVVGKDPRTDVAVIKIAAKTDLATAPFGDSDKLEVGEWLMAIGNSFGLDSTVTFGNR
jgi:serine protease Do